MINALKIALMILVCPVIMSCQDEVPGRISYNGDSYELYPVLLEEMPGIPSPLLMTDGREFAVCQTLDKKYTIIEVTVKNGDMLAYSQNQWWGAGRQLHVDALDFPTLAETGLHSEEELRQTYTITGKSVSDITRDGRPMAFSGTGFMAAEENIISVLVGDNRLVARMGFTHPDVVRPLFHVFNIIRAIKKDNLRGNIKDVLYYNGNSISLKFWGAKGWQESIFNDEIQGYWQIEMQRELGEEEEAFLAERYPDLTEEEMAVLAVKLSYIHTGEMAAFYGMRYGFYEGHTDYRADPISIASVFGLRSLEELENAFENDLYRTLTEHFIE
jgi:hypothetical protein